MTAATSTGLSAAFPRMGAANNGALAFPAVGKPLMTKILLIEDDDNDIYFVKRATEQGPAGHTVHAVHDGEEALDYLYHRGTFAGNTDNHPVLVLLDLKMPRVNGFQVLDWLSRHRRFCPFPVVVFSSSDLQEDVERAYAQGVVSFYLTKPDDFEKVPMMLQQVHARWHAAYRSEPPTEK